ncbi:Smr/MutS family protein [Sulfidibacter corallicola]|uniref:Smr/MutS family protein n=1 Tax=Sulfidibacter corallicola TaxID=2818388 RepID=A0A8A4TVS4_SULCO|nr:Smr/MutS family protein [Sulfidibacter corallicola]QTD53467.1 Smr/MutS family protein [Sulfidibacter corallicola]
MNQQAPRPRKAPRLRDQTRESLEFPTILQFFASRTQTRQGRALLLELDLMPPARQSFHFGQLDRWCQLLEERDPLRFPTIPGPDFFDREPHTNPFDAEELRRVRDVLNFFAVLEKDESLSFTRCLEPGTAIASEIPDDSGDPDETAGELKRLTRLLGGLFKPDGDWREDISPLYGSLIKQFVQTDEQLDAVLKNCLSRYNEFLSEAIVFERNHRKVLAVKLDFKGKVRGILQDYSASGRTVFMEPESTVALQNRLTEIVSEIEEELWRIRVEISSQILAIPVIGRDICPRLARMDMMQTLALCARATESTPIAPNHERDLSLLRARHPLLDESFAAMRMAHYGLEEPDSNHMVPFSLHLDEELRGLVVSGANTGGKTVTLKTTGLLAWMANSGLPVPLDEGSRIPFYDTIFGDIGDHQSLSHNLSTYASHLVSMREVLARTTGTGLILLDELGSGTDPNEGNALAQAMMEAILETGDHLMVTTHQQILCTLALTHPAMENGSMSFDSRALKPTYIFNQGVPGRSHALEIAGNSGMPATVLARAKELIDDNQVDVQAAIRKLQEQHRDLNRQKNKLRKDELRLHRRIQDTRKETDRLKQVQEEFREKERVRIAKAVDKAERELRQMLTEVSSQKQARRGFTKFAAVKKELMEPLQTEKLPQVEVTGSGLSREHWKVGDRVWLKTWRMEGVITAVDRKKFRVDCKGKFFHLGPEDLLHMKQPERAERPKIMEHLESESDANLSMEVRLLGFRVEEALMEVDQTIDQALRRQMPLIRLIHGHGTGALKTAIREHLKIHPAASQFEVVIERENDGVTELRFGF